MSKRLFATASVALLAMAPLAVATPAAALTVEDCGGTPEGATVVILGDRCEVYWDTAGVYEWRPPANISEMWAIIVGAGGGGGGRADQNEAFAGDGGSMNYIAFMADSAVQDYTFTVGAGGASSTTDAPGEDGGWTMIISTDMNHGVPGGEGNGPTTANFGTCGAEIAGYTFGEGSRVDSVQTSDGTCVGGASGIVPSSDFIDTDLFIDDDRQYSWGGGVYINTTPTALKPGQGAQVVYTDANGASVDAFGSDGFVVFRYTLSPIEPVTTLAATGVDAPLTGLTAGALGLGGVGLAAIAAARRARRTN